MATGRDPVIMSLHLLRLAISIPSLLLYCVQLNAIRRCPKLHTHFFKLFALRAIIGIFYEARFCIGSVFPFFGLFYDIYEAVPKWVLKTNLYNLHMFYMDDVVTAIMLLNRMTALAFPVKQNEIWRRAFPVSVIAIFLVPGSLCTYLFSEQAVLVVIPEEDGTGTNDHVMSFALTFTYQLGPNDEQPAQRMARETIVFGIIFILLCLLLNLFTFVAYRKYYKNLTVTGTGENVAEVIKERRTEVKITIYAVATFFSHTLIILMQQPAQRMARETIVFGIIFILLCLLLNLFTFVAYRKYYKNLTVTGTGENVAEVIKERRTEVKITIYAVATFFSHTLIILMQVIIYALLKAGSTASVLRIQYLNGILYIFCATTLPAALMHWSSAEVHQRTVNTVKWTLLLPKKCLTCTNSVSTDEQPQHTQQQCHYWKRQPAALGHAASSTGGREIAQCGDHCSMTDRNHYSTLFSFQRPFFCPNI